MTELIQNIFNLLHLERTANIGDVAGIIFILIILIAAISKLFTGRVDSTVNKKSIEKKDILSKEQVDENKVIIEPVKEVTKTAVPKISWSDRLSKGLSRSSGEIWGKVFGLFSNGLTEDVIEEVEELLYGADLGPTIVSEIIEKLENEVKSGNFNQDDFKKFLFNSLKEKIENVQKTVPEYLYKPESGDHKKLRVIMIVGVNGAGKTTTIGKLATKLTNSGAKVVVGACDTFRAAAVDQLQVWCDRANATMIRAKEGASPSGVGYEALQKAVSLEADYCLLDTAGRLHTKENLMDELRKSKDVLKKLIPDTPDEIILVLDAITGQNAMRQAEEFNKILGLTGLVFTKCDGSSKAGSAISIVEKLGVPISYIGVGESVDDLDRFNTDDFLNALLGNK